MYQKNIKFLSNGLVTAPSRKADRIFSLFNKRRQKVMNVLSDDIELTPIGTMTTTPDVSLLPNPETVLTIVNSEGQEIVVTPLTPPKEKKWYEKKGVWYAGGGLLLLLLLSGKKKRKRR